MSGRAGAAVRPAVERDVDALVAIENASFPEDERAERRAFRHGIRSPTVSVLVLADGEAPAAGYVIVERRRNSSVARLTSIAVAPDRAGAGGGRRLLEAAEADSARHGARRLRLEVRADNAAAQRLYERAGYTRFGIVDDYYEDGTAAWRYEKELRPAAVKTPGAARTGRPRREAR